MALLGIGHKAQRQFSGHQPLYHKKMLAVFVFDVEIESEYQFERRMFSSNPEQHPAAGEECDLCRHEPQIQPTRQQAICCAHAETPPWQRQA
jgi:hypothetical protein